MSEPNNEWLGTCQTCSTQRPIGEGISSLGRKWLHVLLMCDKCGSKHAHKFRLHDKPKEEQQ